MKNYFTVEGIDEVECSHWDEKKQEVNISGGDMEDEYLKEFQEDNWHEKESGTKYDETIFSSGPKSLHVGMVLSTFNMKEDASQAMIRTTKGNKYSLDSVV